VGSIPLEGIQMLVIYGIGVGYAYQALLPWLRKDPNHRLVFLEDDIRVIGRFLEQKNAHELLCDSQTHLYYIEDNAEGLQVLQGVAWACLKRKAHIEALPFYARQKEEVFSDIKKSFLFQASDIHATCDEYIGFGLPFYCNFWRNLFFMPESLQAKGLYGAFKGYPAIVVAAGPSLAAQYERLQEVRDRAVIFAGGSSINALYEGGVFPHFGASIDPNPTQYMRLRQALSFQLPYFYRHRMFHEAGKMITGPKLYLRGGDGYNTPEWIEKKAGMKGRILGGGHSVSNFCIEIAYALGCSPIILVGFDLSYGDDLSIYPLGVDEQAVAQEEVVDWEGFDGKPLKTSWKWVVEAKWIEDFKRRRPRAKIVNATHQGMRLYGVRHRDLDACIEQYLTKQYDMDALVHRAIQQLPRLPLSTEKLLDLLSKMYDSLQTSIAHIEKLVYTLKNSSEDCRETPSFIEELSFLHQLDAYQYLLEVFDRMRTKQDYYTLQFSLSPLQPEKFREHLEKNLMADRLLFLKKVAMANQALLVLSVAEQQSKGHSIASFAPKSEVRWP
jgi:hypothetical protein